jgi:uncharacterized protein (TIGR04222 family)
MFMELNPLNFNGPTFLAFFLVLLALGSAVQVLLRSWLTTPSMMPNRSGQPPKPLSLYELAYLRGQAVAIGQVGIVELLNQRLIEPDAQSGRFRAIGMVDRGALKSLDDVPAMLLRACQSGSGLLPGAIRKEVAFTAQRLRNNLELMGLVSNPATRFWTAGTSTMIFGSIILLGVSKLFVGLERDKPVGFLIILLLTALVLGILLGITKHVTAAGQQRLVDSRCELGQIKPADSLNPNAQQHHVDATSMAAMSMAVLGLSATGSQFMLDPESKRLLDRAERSAATSGSGCGATGCGGDGGGGGGGGGGGCGGCGGGD